MLYVGIDIGTKYSSLSILDEYGKPIAIGVDDLNENNKIMPTAVFIEETGNIFLGTTALKLRLKNPRNFKERFKSDFGENISYKINGVNFYSHDFYKEIIINFKKRAEDYTGKIMQKAVLTYPAAYNNDKINLLKKTVILAGFKEVMLIDEPTAAAYYYFTKFNFKKGEKLLVYDFGAGFFNLAFVEFRGNEFIQLAEPMGEKNCGGNNIDNEIFKKILNIIPFEILNEVKKNLLNYEMLIKMIENLSVEIKHMLSKTENHTVHIPISLTEKISFSLNRKSLNKIIEPIMNLTINKTKEIIKKASLQEKDIHMVLITGGTSMILYVKDRLEDVFVNKVYKNTDTLSVCYGAVLYSNKNLVNSINIKNIERYGSNRWSDSNIRDWLNSNENKVKFKTNPPSKEAIWKGSNVYENEPGFLTNFSEEEIEKISVFNHDNLEDIVFLLSEEEIEDLWPVKTHRQKIVTESAARNDDYNGGYKSEAGKVSWYWTRTPLPSPSRVYVVFSYCDSIYYSYGIAYYGHVGVVPALYLKSENS